MVGDIVDRRALDTRRDVVPPERGSRRMIARVEAIAALRRQIDPSDERDTIVDHDRLLVVAVQRTLMRIKRTLDSCATRKLIAHSTNLAP